MSACHDVAENRRSSRQAAGSFAEHELTVVAFAAYDDTVVFVVDAVYILRRGDEFGHYEEGEFAVGDFDDLGHEFDLVAFFAGKANVEVADGADAVCEYFIGTDVDAYGVDGDDDELEQRVETVDVKRGVGFGETEFLGAAQGVGIALVVVEDLREYIV